MKNRCAAIAVVFAWTTIASGAWAGKITQYPRTLGILVNQTGKSDYASGFGVAKAAGMQETTLSQGWDQLELAPGKYDSKWLDVANSFYPGQGTKISLVITTIDTNHLRLPADLKGKRFDDPIVISRFENLLKFVAEHTQKLPLVCLSIGNEVDAYLGQDADKWRQYTRFFIAASDYARRLKPGLVVGCKTTFAGTVGNCSQFIKTLNQSCDSLMVTYYPLEPSSLRARDPQSVFGDFNRIVELYPNKPIYILEAGYPSSESLGGSEAKQATFVLNAFNAWDRSAAHIKLIEFLWLNEMTNTELDFFSQYYGSKAPQLREFLGSLGLRTVSGREKQALNVLRKQSQLRAL